MTDLPRFATEEFTRRRTNARRAVERCRMTLSQAEQKMLFWAVITVRAGGDLPEDIRNQLHRAKVAGGDSAQPTWWELTPQGTDPALFLTHALRELQRAATAALIKHTATTEDTDRTRGILALYNQVAAPVLGPLPLQKRAEDTPAMKEAA
ncbi:hypothetical protein [Croceicoccus sp. BE223]|uniref:hypothetical protein n=1 Tax=Croceicoccus sp. BE223 TaxID=2817716 RepID=UPI0028583782|nr:hypothetical protein [Croceicoccus sp. BE223]MDR7101484.1 hypothetical protein [Croceicoccus sp. BE223]